MNMMIITYYNIILTITVVHVIDTCLVSVLQQKFNNIFVIEFFILWHFVCDDGQKSQTAIFCTYNFSKVSLIIGTITCNSFSIHV